jgi:hypothetical protein
VVVELIWSGSSRRCNEQVHRAKHGVDLTPQLQPEVLSTGKRLPVVNLTEVVGDHGQGVPEPWQLLGNN